MNRQRQPGFTLIELLVVIVILLLLSGMVMSMISQARRMSMKSNTLAIERKVETSLRLFKDELAVYPYQQTYPELSATVVNQYFPNHLYYHVGNNISSATGGDRDRIMTDVAAARADFAYNATETGYYGGTSEGTQPSVFTYTASTIIQTGSMHVFYNPVTPNTLSFATEAAIATMINRIAEEWVGNAVMAGAVAVKGQVVFDQFGVVTRDLSSATILSSPESAGNPGWANDYLTGEVDAHYIRGMDILDAWHNPLIYICQVIPGVKGATSYSNGCTLLPFDTRYYGLGPQGFDPGTGPVASLAALGRRILDNSGRVRLSLGDAGDGQPTPADPTYFPNAGTLIQSDMRYYAAPGYETEFELWSAGYDGMFSYTRSDPADSDNISATDFCRGLR